MTERISSADGAPAPERASTRPATRWLPRIAAGDRDAFERFYDAYSPTIYGILLRIAGDANDAADLLQETFVQAWQAAARHDPSRGSEIAWLITIARSRAIDRLRARRTRSVREEEGGREILDARPFVDHAGERNAELSEARRIVKEAMAELPPEQREVIEMAYFQEKSHSEIAAALGQPLGSVKTRIQLGMKKLRTRIAGLYRP